MVARRKNRPKFQSTLPARGATNIPRVLSSSQKHFNPRSLHGERLIDALTAQRIEAFQSTLPARGATEKPPEEPENQPISIHAPCTGSDRSALTRG